MRYISILLLPLFFSLISIAFQGCGTEPDKGNAINPNIVKIKDCCGDELVTGNYFQGLYFDKTIITTGPITLFRVDSSYKIIERDNIWMDIVEKFENPFGIGFYISLNTTKDKLIFVKSLYGDASVGGLYEYGLESEELIQIRDSSYNISSAEYWNGDDSKLVYYSYGNDQGLEAGYYLYNKTTGTDSLMLAYRSPAGPMEMINGFDIHPNNTRLLIPLVQADEFTIRDPLIGVYDVQQSSIDTLNITFGESFARIGLWLCYSPDGSHILYSNFPLGSFTSTTNDWSEVGIIETTTREKRILDVNTNEEGLQHSVQIAPTWSPDGKHIIYGSAPVIFPSGEKGHYSLYVLKNVDNPRNYK